MKRLKFLQSIFAATAVGSALGFKTISESVKLTDVFQFWEHNENMASLKEDSEYFKSLISDSKNAGLKIYEHYPVYCGIHDFHMPLKEEYSKTELSAFFNRILLEFLKNKYVIHSDRESIVRIYCDRNSGVIIPDIYITNTWNEFHDRDLSKKFN